MSLSPLTSVALMCVSVKGDLDGKSLKCFIEPGLYKSWWNTPEYESLISNTGSIQRTTYSHCAVPSYPQSSPPRPTLISPPDSPPSSRRPTLLRLASRASASSDLERHRHLPKGSGAPREG
ncbi:hypothetical protein EYF80_041755 [Liparis tanakae]|uniref:Uncharacterized protein n=1 Tax=Liparis tanakae TaxID=230148 RepID=A0A4Z2G4I1_9TELE|nr:hypothetical protein EYF80_041755 [Liparis tanakae]